MTKIEKDGFTCENKANVFPQNIIYYRESDVLKTQISSEDIPLKVDYDFEITEDLKK